MRIESIDVGTRVAVAPASAGGIFRLAGRRLRKLPVDLATASSR